jgi:lipid A 3-O-deacylase
MASIRFYRSARPIGRSRIAVPRRRLPALTASLVLAAVLAFGAAVPAARADVHLSNAGRQLRFGVLLHDMGRHFGKEDGTDVTLEYRGAPLTGGFWQTIFSPRPHIGANLDASGKTSSLYAGLTWLVDVGSYFYASADFGGAVHNGKLKAGEPGRAELGSRVLFHEAAELGVRLGAVWRVGVRVDHMSNGDLATPNDGITNIGLMFSRQF